jgi:hypothetical protein
MGYGFVICIIYKFHRVEVNKHNVQIGYQGYDNLVSLFPSHLVLRC